MQTLAVRLVVTVVIASASAIVLARAAPVPARYYMVDELLEAHDLPTREIKVHGWIVAGSIVERRAGTELHRTFVLHKRGKKLRVFHEGPLPDTVKDQSELVVTGALVPSEDKAALAGELDVDDDLPVIAATNLSSKCSHRYDATPSKNPRFE